jgi:sterol desaturase/sphingolipid hydroxylase (fatty acid hydroxylase superfamily)
MNGLSGDLKAVYDVVYYVAFNFAKAVLAFLQRDSYLYWPFIVSTLAIMVAVAWFAARPEGRGWRRQFGDYFSARVWWHPSARADYRLYFANALLLPLIFGWLLFSDAHVAGIMDSMLGRQGAAPQAASAGIAGKLVYTMVFFVAYDFGRFVAHCLLHDVPALWAFHKVHHSAEVLTPMTAFRAHPFDLLVMAWVPALTTGLATWVFNLFSPGTVGFYTFLGLHVALWTVNLIDNLRHSHVWVTYGPRIGLWIVSPAHHQLHHSCEAKHSGKRGGSNRGFSLAVWDRLYGTLRMPEARAETFRMGLGDGTEPEWHSVRRMYLRPFAGALGGFRRRPGSLSRPPK